MKKGRILVVDDNKAILTAVRMLLETRFKKVLTLASPHLIKNTLQEEKVDVVLLDMNFSAGINTGNEGLFWLAEIRKMDASIQVVLFTAYADIGLAVRGMKEGAADFIVKPWDNTRLVETLLKCAGPRSTPRPPEGGGSETPPPPHRG
jgi:DNA-binding NtrC family response regulator